jgi:hypothetical protein
MTIASFIIKRGTPDKSTDLKTASPARIAEIITERSNDRKNRHIAHRKSNANRFKN